MYGHGYFLSLGWHNRVSNSVMRNEKEVLVDEKGVQLKQDRWYHVLAQFIPDRCQLCLDGKLVIDYRDEDWIEGINAGAVARATRVLGHSGAAGVRVRTPRLAGTAWPSRRCRRPAHGGVRGWQS